MRQVALLRGINVGGHKPVGMAALKSVFVEAGFKAVDTYLQSGNVVFSTSLSSETVKKKIETVITKNFGHQVDVIIKSAAEMRQIAESNPFLADPGVDTKRLNVSFLWQMPSPELLLSIPADFGGDDRFAVIDDVVYLFTPNGYGRTKLNNSLFERKFKTTATTRNWNTVTALAKLAQG